VEDTIHQLITEIKLSNVEPNYEVFAFLLGKTNNYDEVKIAVKELKELGLILNEEMYEIQLELSEDFVEANKLLIEMQKNSIKPTYNTFVTVVGKTDEYEQMERVRRKYERIYSGQTFNDDILKVRRYEETLRIECREELRQKFNEKPYKIENDKNIITNIDLDIDSELAESDEYYKDGASKTFHGKRYERNPLNRANAIKTHGLDCVVCGFNFEKFYGVRGTEFIEVHHVNPLSTVNTEVLINPETDLVSVCSNCHRMIHRRKDKVLTIEEMKKIVKSMH